MLNFEYDEPAEFQEIGGEDVVDPFERDAANTSDEPSVGEGTHRTPEGGMEQCDGRADAKTAGA